MHVRVVLINTHNLCMARMGFWNMRHWYTPRDLAHSLIIYYYPYSIFYFYKESSRGGEGWEEERRGEGVEEVTFRVSYSTDAQKKKSRANMYDLHNSAIYKRTTEERSLGTLFPLRYWRMHTVYPYCDCRYIFALGSTHVAHDIYMYIDLYVYIHIYVYLYIYMYMYICIYNILVVAL